MNKNKGFTKSIAFTLVMAMLFATLSFGGMAGLPGVPGVGGAEAYGAESITATVRIEGYDSTFLPPTEVTVPAGATVMDAINAAIDGKGITIEASDGYISSISKDGVTWTGSDPRFKPVDPKAYNLSGWTYHLNDNSYNDSINSKRITNGDQIVLCYSGTGDYGFFENFKVKGVVGEPIEIKLKKDSWGTKSLVEDASIYHYQDNNTELGVTSSMGALSLTFSEVGTFEITGEKFIEGYNASGDIINSISRPYAKITVISAKEMENIIDADWTNLDIEYNGTASSITLPSSGPSGASIAWSSSPSGVISNDGTVKRPLCGQGDQMITMSAVIGSGSYTREKEFSIPVQAYTEEDVQATLDKMGVYDVPSEVVETNILYVGTYSWDNQIKFAWQSSHPEIIGVVQGEWGDLQVTRPAINEPDVFVTLTAIATNGNVSKKRDFVVRVTAFDVVKRMTTVDLLKSNISGYVKSNNLITWDMANGSEWIMAMISSGNESNITAQDQYNYLAMALEESRGGNTTIGKKAKIITALTALGIDPTSIPGKEDGQVINLVEEIYHDGPAEGFGGQYSIAYVLMAYNLGFDIAGYDEAKLIEQLINQIAEIEGGPDNENFYNEWASDTVGLYLAVLAPYYGTNSTAQGIVINGINWIAKNQEKGTFGNANSDAMVVLGLSEILDNNSDNIGISPFYDNWTELLYQMGDGLLSYKTQTDNGFQLNSEFNLLATVQGFLAIEAYKDFLDSKSGKSNLFSYSINNFNDEVSWPTERYPLDIAVTPPTNTSFNKNETVDTSALDFIVKATYSDDTTATIPNSLCTVSTLDTSTAGAKEVKVSFMGKVKTFTVIVKDPVTPVVPKEVTLTINGTSVSGKKIVIHSNSTVLSVLQEACGLYGVDILSHKGYVSSMNGLAEFDQGPNSGWLYQVDGNTPSTTGADQYKLTGGERVTWYYTKDFTKDASSSAWVTENQAGAVQDGLVSVTTDVKAVTGSDGTAKATVSTTQLDTAVTDALKAAAASKDDAKPAITIAIEADSKAQGVETVIPKAALANLVNKGIQQMTIASPLGNMTLDLETLKDIVKGGTGDVSLSIKKAEESQGRPVIRLEINNGGKTVGTFSKPITVTVPYAPAAGETEQGIAVFHLDMNGQWKSIKASKYDSKNKAIVFRTDHFSDFVIAYSHKTFGDIKGHWAQTPIEYLASRRIIQGMTEEFFAPNGTITRAQFVTLLAGMAGADLSQYSLSQFNDVKDNAWYKGAVVWAAENGIVQGQQAADGGFWFNPNQNISRQDMAVVMMRYLAWAKEPAKETTKAIAFKDGSVIASYAKESVATMQKAGLINGRTTPDNQTVFDPAGKLTRAEAAQILTNQLYQQF